MSRLAKLLVAFALIWGTSAAQAATEFSGQSYDVGDFLAWAPQAATFDYRDLRPAADRLARFRSDRVPDVDRLYRVRVDLKADGAVEQRWTWARYLVTESGVQDAGNMTFWVDAHGQFATIQQAYTLLPDGRRIEVVPETIQVVADSEDDIFSDSFQVVVPFPALEVGAAMVLSVHVEQDTEAWPLPWSQIYFPQIFTLREEFDFELHWEEGRPAPRWRSDFEPLRCVEKNRSVACRASEIPPYPAEDPNVRYYDALPSLVVAETTTWEGLAQQVGALVDSAAGSAPAIAEASARLLRGADSEAERLDRLHRFVSQKVRYLGLEQGLGGIVPRPAATTLERRFGDCKDKTALFIALARQAGLDAYPVLTSSERSSPDKLLIPAAAYFDHMVSCVRLSDGDEFCVDLTDPHSPYVVLSAGVQGAVRLDLAGAKPELRRFAAPEYRWTLVTNTVNRFQGDGSLIEEQARVYMGTYAAGFRSMLKPREQEDRLAWALENYQETVSDWVEPRFDFEGIDDVMRPLVLRSTARFTEFFDPAGFVSYRDPDAWLAYEARTSKTENQVHPYSFPGIKVHSRTSFELPEGRRLMYEGPKLRFETAYGSLERSFQSEDGKLHVETELLIPRAEIPVEEIERFNLFLDYVEEHSVIQFTLEALPQG